MQKWLKVSLGNLFIVSILGVILRYKIAFSLPFIDQKKLLHAHSHFAFAGWITQVLMVLLVSYLIKSGAKDIVRKYTWILLANLITAYGMLFTFPFQGYGLYSISFSTLSIFVSYIFAVVYWRDLNKLPEKNVSHLWFKAAIFFNALSSIGAFALAGMMVMKIIHQNWYLEGQYFFLHFQYNGWFFFACMGLLTSKLIVFGVKPRYLYLSFWLFAAACFPAYILSVLWLKISIWAYILVVAAAAAQLAGWCIFISLIFGSSSFLRFLPIPVKQLFFLAATACSIKLMLQLCSTIPSISKLAFGFRPIVIAYLHLVLLGTITFFIIGYIMNENSTMFRKKAYWGITIFATGVILNEIVLMLQGVSNLNSLYIPYNDMMLLVVALIMLLGLSITISQIKIMGVADVDHNLLPQDL